MRAIGLQERIARKPHVCFLCSLPILPKTKYQTWGHADNGSFYRLKVHNGCESYASTELRDAWAYGDGLDSGAVESDIRDRLLLWRGDEVVGLDRTVEASLREKCPEVSTLIDLIVTDISREYCDE